MRLPFFCNILETNSLILTVYCGLWLYIDLLHVVYSKVIFPMDNDQKLLKLVWKWFKAKHYGIGDKKQEEELAILLTTGGLNPIHTGHVDMMNFAKQELESQKLDKKYTVIGGFMSPSHDEYVRSKTSYIRSNDRVKMIKLAVKNSPWIECDEWECKQEDFVDFPKVCQKFTEKINSEQFKKKIREYIGKNYKKLQWKQANGGNDNEVKIDQNKIQLANMSIFYVCGSDRCDKCWLWNGINGYNGVLVAKTMVVPRPNDDNSNNARLKSNSKNCVVVNVPPIKMNYDRSSTQIRKYIQDSKGKLAKFNTIKRVQKIVEKKILDPNVLRYIEENLHELYKQLKDKDYTFQNQEVKLKKDTYEFSFDTLRDMIPDLGLKQVFNYLSSRSVSRGDAIIKLLKQRQAEVIDVLRTHFKISVCTQDGTIWYTVKELPHAAPWNSKAILWVDDKPEDNQRIIEKLQEEGKIIITKKSTTAALDFLKCMKTIFLNNDDFNKYRIVSDMTRYERKNEYDENSEIICDKTAGARLVHELRKAGYSNKVCIYTSDKEHALKECDKLGCIDDRIFATVDPNKCYEFCQGLNSSCHFSL